MTDSDTAIKDAKRFATALASNIKLLNAFIAAERKIIQIDPQFSTAGLDNFLVQHGYQCTIDQVATYGRPILSDPTNWAGTYNTQTAPKASTSWSDGPQLVIGADGGITMDGVREANVKFNFLNMTFPEANLLFYMATPGAHEGADPPPDATRAKAFFGTYLDKKIVGIVVPPSGQKTPSKKPDTFMTTFGVIAKYMGQINQAFMIYDLIKKATNAEASGNEAAVAEARGEISPQITELSESQGEVATTQQSAIETEMGENPGMTLEEAADALRSVQADDLGVEEVADVEEAQLDAAGEAIAEVPVEEGGIEVGAALGEEAVGELTVDVLLEDALLVVLL